MFSWVGFRQVGVPYRGTSARGKTKYPLRKLIRLASDGLLCFSAAPLRLALILGFVVSSLAFLLGVVCLLEVRRLCVPGWPSIALVVTFLGGIQLS